MSHRTRSRVSLMLVQSIVCGVILLLVLILRLVGGETYGRLKDRFRDFLTEDEWAPPTETSAVLPSRPLGEAVAVNVSLPSFCAPLDGGTVTSGFGERADPISGETSFHGGVDVSAAEGTALYAPSDGVVRAAAWDSTYGHYVILACGDADVLYAHCSALLCEKGDSVRAGERVARVGHSGRTTGAHVHMELIRDGVRCDPSPLLAGIGDA